MKYKRKRRASKLQRQRTDETKVPIGGELLSQCIHNENKY